MNTSKRTEQFKHAENRNQQYQIKVLKMSTTPYRQTNVCFCTRNTPETKKKETRKARKQNEFEWTSRNKMTLVDPPIRIKLPTAR